MSDGEAKAAVTGKKNASHNQQSKNLTSGSLEVKHSRKLISLPKSFRKYSSFTDPGSANLNPVMSGHARHSDPLPQSSKMEKSQQKSSSSYLPDQEREQWMDKTIDWSSSDPIGKPIAASTPKKTSSSNLPHQSLRNPKKINFVVDDLKRVSDPLPQRFKTQIPHQTSVPYNFAPPQGRVQWMDKTIDWSSSNPIGKPIASSTPKKIGSSNLPHQSLRIPNSFVVDDLKRVSDPLPQRFKMQIPHQTSVPYNFAPHQANIEGGQAHVPTVIEVLRQKLAEAEVSLEVEKLTVDELKARISEETQKYEKEVFHAQQLHQEVEQHKIYLQEIESNNELLREKIEAEKQRMAYLMKMKDPSPEFLKEREEGLIILQDERAKNAELVEVYKSLQEQLATAENELENLKNKPEIQDALQKLSELKEYEARIQLEYECANDIAREVETEKATNDQLAGELDQVKRTILVKKMFLENIISEKNKLQAKLDEMVLELDHYTQREKMMGNKIKTIEDQEQSHSKRRRSSSPQRPIVIAHSTPISKQEANSALQKLITERENLNSEFSRLNEQKELLSKSLMELRQENDQLKKEISGVKKHRTIN